MFSRQGYAGTSTREIAKHAGAAEQLIYKHFHSKAALFAAAVLEPLEAALGDAEQRFDDLQGLNDAQRSLEFFVKNVLSTAFAERKLLMAFLGVAAFESGEFLQDGQGPVHQLVERMRAQEELGKRVGSTISLNIEDSMMETRLVTAFILSLVLLEDILFDPDERDRDRMERSLIKLLLNGLSGGRAASGEAVPAARGRKKA